MQSKAIVERKSFQSTSKCFKGSVIGGLIIIILSFLTAKGFIQIVEFDEQQNDVAENIDSYRINLNPQIHKQIQPFSLPVYCRARSFSLWNSSRLSSFKTNLYRFDKLPYSNLILAQELNASFPARHYEEIAMYIKEYPINSSIYIHSAPLYLTLLLGALTPNTVSIVISETNPIRKLILTNYVLNNLQHRLIFQESGSSQQLKEAEIIVASSFDWILLHLGRRVILVVDSEAYKLDGIKLLKLESIPSCSPLQRSVYSQKSLKSGLYLVQPEH